jgi:hypothetical protein
VQREVIIAGIIAIAEFFKEIHEFPGYGKAGGTVAPDRLTRHIFKYGPASIKVLPEFRMRDVVTELVAVSM